jgi:glutathione S-transferase
MAAYKLYYFNARARGEICRLILAATGQKYEDIRYEFDQWPAHKSEMPLGQIPVLEFDGTKLPQSLAISRFLAKQGQLAGDDNLEQAKVDAVVDTANDALAVYLTTFNEKDETKKQELIKKILDIDLPKHLENLEILAKSYGNGGPWFVGNKLTWADLFVYVVLENFLEMNADCLNNYPWLKQNNKEVENQPRIAEHMKTRPVTPF